MKWILYLLLLANAAFFAWQYQLREASRAASEAREVAGPAYVTRLVMLSEVGGGGVAAEPASSGAGGAGSAHSAQSGVPVSATPAAPGSDVANAVPNGTPVAAPAGLASPGVGLSAPEVASPVTPAVSVVAATSLSSVPAVDPPVSLAVPSPPPRAAEDAAPPPASVPPPAASPPAAVPVAEVSPPERRRCYSVGPLADDAPIDAVRAWLVQQGAQVQSRVEQRQEPRSFWVYIPPAASAVAARETADRLQADGVKDVMRMSAGAMANAISLGLYNRKAAADQRVAELKRAGYGAEVETRFKEVRESWLEATFEGVKDLPREAFRTAFPQLKAAGSSCR